MLQTNARDAEQCIKKEREISQSLRDELEASQALVAQLLPKSNTSTNDAFVVEKISRRTKSSSKSGTALAATVGTVSWGREIHSRLIQ